MTKDEFQSAVQEAVDKALAKAGPQYDEAKEKSKEAYAKLVALWGRRIANTVLIGGALAVAFFAGKWL